MHIITVKINELDVFSLVTLLTHNGIALAGIFLLRQIIEIVTCLGNCRVPRPFREDQLHFLISMVTFLSVQSKFQCTLNMRFLRKRIQNESQFITLYFDQISTPSCLLISSIYSMILIVVECGITSFSIAPLKILFLAASISYLGIYELLENEPQEY